MMLIAYLLHRSPQVNGAVIYNQDSVDIWEGVHAQKLPKLDINTESFWEILSNMSLLTRVCSRNNSKSGCLKDPSLISIPRTPCNKIPGRRKYRLELE